MRIKLTRYSTWMAIAFLVAASVFSPAELQASPGDTTWVTVYNLRKLTQHGNVDTTAIFPTGKTYRKIRMHYILSRYACPGSPQYCGSWDYTTQIFARPSNNDSVEIGRVITPYATDWLVKNKTHDYVLEVTEYASILQGTTDMRFRYDGYSWGFAITLKMEFIEGTPIMDAHKVQKVYQGYFPYGASGNSIENYLVPKNFTHNTLTDRVVVKNIISGHGADNSNCAEFCNAYYLLNLDNNQVAQKQLWRPDCGSNHVYPQTGTWIYNRANWCPGDVVWPIYHDLAGQTTANTVFTLNVDMQAYNGNGSAGYIYETQLLHFGAPNHFLDLSIEEILAPTKNENFYRNNPRCTNATIRIKNAGTDPITTAVFSYGQVNGAQMTYTWTGNLGFAEVTEVVFPVSAAVMSNSVASKFHVNVVSVNGGQDEDQFNDTYRTDILGVPVYPKDFIIRIMSNNVGSDNVWTLYDEYDNPIVTNGPFNNATVVRDTIYNLPPGCYKFEITDNSCNGLGWWANPQAGNGSLRFDPITNGTPIFNFPIDFGCGYVKYFTIADPNIFVGVASDEAVNEIQVFPVPASTEAIIKIDLHSATAQSYSIIDINGKNLSTTNLHTREGYFKADLSSFESGLYFIRIDLSDGSSVTKKLVVQK